MVNQKEILKIIKDRKKAHPEDPRKEELFWIPLRDALGDDEQDALSYLKNVDGEKVVFFSEIYEEVVEKFPSDEMEDVFRSIINTANEYLESHDVFEPKI